MIRVPFKDVKKKLCEYYYEHVMTPWIVREWMRRSPAQRDIHYVASFDKKGFNDWLFTQGALMQKYHHKEHLIFVTQEEATLFMLKWS